MLIEMLTISNSDFNETGIRDLNVKISILQMMLTLKNILTQYQNALAYHLQDRAKYFTTSLHVRTDMEFIDIHLNFLSKGHCEQPQWTKSVSRFLIIV